MKTKKLISMFASGVALLFATGMFAQAATIDIYDGSKLFGTLSWDDTNVSVEALPTNQLQAWNNEDQLGQFNTVFGSNYTGLSKEEFDDDLDGSGFSISSSEFSLKFGSGLVAAFFRISGTDPVTYPVSFSWAGVPGEGAGLSHTASPVPLPAAAYLFGSALLGMAGIGYSRNKKQV